MGTSNSGKVFNRHIVCLLSDCFSHVPFSAPFSKAGANPKHGRHPRWSFVDPKMERDIFSVHFGVFGQGSLKDTFCQFETWLFSTKTKGNHHLQGNVQVYNVRIPVGPRQGTFCHNRGLEGMAPSQKPSLGMFNVALDMAGIGMCLRILDRHIGKPTILGFHGSDFEKPPRSPVQFEPLRS